MSDMDALISEEAIKIPPCTTYIRLDLVTLQKEKPRKTSDSHVFIRKDND